MAKYKNDNVAANNASESREADPQEPKELIKEPNDTVNQPMTFGGEQAQECGLFRENPEEKGLFRQ